MSKLNIFLLYHWIIFQYDELVKFCSLFDLYIQNLINKNLDKLNSSCTKY